MGMFDYLYCEHPLPEGGEKYQQRQFQTKDTPSQFMETYIITADGRLTKTTNCVMMEEEEIEAAKAEAETAGHSIYPVMKMEEIEEEVPFHGDIFFYDYDPTAPEGEQWLEYKARFTNDRLEWIKRVEEER